MSDSNSNGQRELDTLKTILGHADDLIYHLRQFETETRTELFENQDGILACSRNAAMIVDQLVVGFRYLPDVSAESAELRDILVDSAVKIRSEIDAILKVANNQILPDVDTSPKACKQRLISCADHLKSSTIMKDITENSLRVQHRYRAIASSISSS